MNTMLKDNFNLAYKNIRERMSRSILTLLGIAIGIMAIISLMAIGEGMNALSAGVAAIVNNQHNLDEMKRLALELGQFYQGSIKIEIDISREKDRTKLNITEYDL